ncbi:MAG: hypothetical protein JW870_17320 [Candidatus Delongbacteria bacterium]|nr:hypothetical protein [Candidatus Delongbacteria bacterium]
MKKNMFVFVFIILISNSFCITDFAMISSLFNTSANDLAFGLDSGTANIWNTNPFGIWSNPAKFGYHKNFAFAYSNDHFFEEYLSDYVNRSSYITYGWKGIGIMLPAPSKNKRWGTVTSFGEYDLVDPQGNIICSTKPYDSISKFAIGINIIQFISNFSSNNIYNSLNEYVEVSAGYNYDILYSNLGMSYETHEDIEANSHSSGFGLIGRISPFNDYNSKNKFYRLDLVLGIYYLNPEKTKIDYKDIIGKKALPYGTSSAFSGKISVKLDFLPDLYSDFFDSIADNFISFYYSQDNTECGNEENYNSKRWGDGFEITILDFFSYRKGNWGGEIIGETEGFGLNLNYHDILQLQYNQVKYPGVLSSDEKFADYMIRIDFIELYKLWL